MCAVTWCAAINGFSGACLTCVAALCAARFVQEQYVCHLPVEPITKHVSDSRPHSHAILGEGHGARVVLPDGLQYGIAMAFNGRR